MSTLVNYLKQGTNFIEGYVRALKNFKNCFYEQLFISALEGEPLLP